MNLQQAVTRGRTLVVEGCDGVGNGRLLARLAGRYGFAVGCPPRPPHHLDPLRPYHELLAGPGRLACGGVLVSELVYGPLRRGASRVTWIQAFDFAEAVAARDGAFLHLAVPAAVLRERLAGGAGDPAEVEAAVDGYRRAFATLAQHVPVVTVDEETVFGPGGRRVPAARRGAGRSAAGRTPGARTGGDQRSRWSRGPVPNAGPRWPERAEVG